MRAVRVVAVIAIILALLCVFISIGNGFNWVKFGEFAPPEDSEAYNAIMAEPLESGDIIFFVPAALCAVGAGLGIAGVVLARRRGRLSGAFFVASAVLCIFTMVGIVSTLLFIVCAVFAFLSSSRKPDLPQPKDSFRPKAVLIVSIVACTFAIIASLLALFFGATHTVTYYPGNSDNPNMYAWLNTVGLYSLASGILGLAAGIVSLAGIRFSGRKRLWAGIFVIAAAIFCIRLLFFVLTAMLLLGSLHLLWPEKRNPDADEPAQIP